MADKKISELTALTGANVATDDQLVIVDTSAALTKSITIDEFKNALDTATGFVRITGDTMTGDLSMSGANITLGDSSGVSDDRIVLGDDSDLLIYHNNPNSFIRDQGNGNFFITTDGNYIFLAKDDLTNMATFQVDGPVDLYHAGSAKLATTSTGISVTGNATFADNGKAIFGAGSDLWIYHDGTDSYIEERNGTGSLYIDATDLQLRSTANAKYFRGITGGAVDLYYDNASKLATTDTGVDITGTLTSDGLTVSGSLPNIAVGQFINTDTISGNGLFVKGGGSNSLKYSLLTQNGSGASTLRVANNGDISFYDSLGSSQSFFWDASAESLGIGTTSPDKALHVVGGVGDTALFGGINAGTSTENIGGIQLGTSTDTASRRVWGVKAESALAGNLGVWVSADNASSAFSGTQVVSIDSSGNVGIGTSSPSARLHIKESSNLTEGDPHFKIEGLGYSGFHWLDATAYYIGQNSSIRQVRIYSGAETAGVALTNGSTSWGTFSDERLKYDVENIENAVETLSGIRTVKYRLNNVDAPDAKKKLGVIAQDLEGVLDEVVDTTMLNDDDTEYMSVRYTELIPVLIKAIQEQQATITALEARITALENA
jgi:hypothetical protein